MEKTAFILYLIILLLSILMFGAMHTYMYTFMSLGVLLAAVLVVLKGIRKDYRSGIRVFRVQKTGLNLLFVLMLGYLVFQLVPLPAWVLKLLSPEAWVVWQKSIPAIEVVDGKGPGGWHTLAVYGYPVRMSLVRWVVYGLFFFGLIQTVNSRKRINVAIALVLGMGCFEALYGLYETYSGLHQVLWYKMDYAKERVKGTFINGNHFAAYMAMGVALSAAFAGAIGGGKRVTNRRSKQKKGLRAKIAALVEGEEVFSKRILVVLAGVVMGLGLIFSASRGAILSWAGAMFVMGVLMMARKAYRRKGYVLIGIFLLICAYAVHVGVEYPLERFMKIASGIESRSRYADRTLVLFDDFKATGVGLGNFQYAFPKYQSEKDKKKYYIYAHSDWAQLLAEAGVAGLVLLLGGMGYFLYRMLRLWARRRDSYAVCLGVAPVAALVYVGLHSFGEFSLHTPAVMLVLVFILAVGYAALHLERHHRHDRMAYRYYRLPLKSVKGAGVLVLILGVMGWTGWWSIRHFMAEAYCNTVPNSTLNRDPKPPVGEVVKAIEWDGGNAGYWFKIAEGMEQRAGSREKTSTDYADEKGKDVSRKGAKAQRTGDRGQGSVVRGQQSEKKSAEIGVICG